MTAGVHVEDGVGVVAAEAEKDIRPEHAEARPEEGTEAPPADGPPPEEAPAEVDPWPVELSRAFLQHVLEAVDNDAFRTKLKEARGPDAAVGAVGDVFIESFGAISEMYQLHPGLPGIQQALVFVWVKREDEECFLKAKAIEEVVGGPQGIIFLMDWVEERPEPAQVPELNVHRARDLVWKLVKQAESRDFKVALSLIEAIWRGSTEADILNWARQPLYYRFFHSAVLEYGFFVPEPTCLRFTEVVLDKVFTALRAFRYDAETNGLTWRLEKAAGMAPGTIMQVTPETTGGTKYPAFASEPYVNKVHYWEKFNVDAAYEEDGEGIVIPPEAPLPGPAPVLLFLLGHGHFNSRQRFIEGEVNDLLQEETIRRQFWIIVPKPCTRTGMAYWKGRRFEKDWSEDAVWYYFTEVLRKLGPEKVDPARLYITGVSQGGAGTWHMCMKYGRYFAAAMPSGGACEWPHDTWPRGGYPDPEALKELRKVPFRAIHVDCDNHAPPPKKDIEYLTYGIEERSCEIQAFGYNLIKKFPIQIRKWFWEDQEGGDAFIEYWSVVGPLDDGRNLGAWADDRHLIWVRSWVNPYWGVTNFFFENTCPEDRRWRFDDPPRKPDTSKHKADLDNWGYFDPPEKDKYVIREEDDVEVLVEMFRKEAWKSVRYLREGQEVPVSFDFARMREIEKAEFRAVRERPYDRIACMWLKPHVNTIFNLKMVAAERWFEDIQKFDTFGLGFRPPPKAGAPPVEPLPLDTVLTEAHVGLEHCEEKVPRQALDAEEFTVWVLLKHHVDEEKDGYHLTTHTVKKNRMEAADLKKALVPLLWEKRLIDTEDPSTFDLCRASKSAEGPLNKIPGKIPMAPSTTLTVEHQLLEVCKPYLKIELIIDPMTGTKKDYPMELGSTVWNLRFMLSDGNETKARRMAVGVPPKKKTDQAVALEDDVVLSKAHAKLHLWTVVVPKAKAAPK